MRIEFTLISPGPIPVDVDGWARNLSPLSPFQLLTDPFTPAQRDTRIAYAGPGTGWTVEFHSAAAGGFTPTPMTYNATSGFFEALGVIPFLGNWSADCFWEPIALCTEQVVRSKSLKQPNLLEGYDEVIPSTGEVLVFDQPATPPPGLVAVAVTGRGLVWQSGHARGYVYKVGSRTPNRLAGQTIRYAPE